MNEIGTGFDELGRFLLNHQNQIIYVAGPYSQGDVAVNVRKAMHVGMRINDSGNGNYAIVPHLTHFLHMMFPRPYEYWLDVDNRIIPYCTALVRLMGDSSGADKEVEFAKSLGIRIILL